jgi:hypothetical protein
MKNKDHGAEVFCKRLFKDEDPTKNYDNMTVKQEDKSIIRFYCLAMALESKRMTTKEMKDLKDSMIA